MDQNQAIAAFIEEKKEEMLALWKELVNLESYVGEADHVTAVLRRVQQELEAEGILYTLPKKGVFVRGLPVNAKVSGVETEVRQLLQLCRKLKISTEELIEIIRKEGKNDVDR